MYSLTFALCLAPRPNFQSLPSRWSDITLRLRHSITAWHWYCICTACLNWNKILVVWAEQAQCLQCARRGPPIKCLCMGPRDVTWRRARTSQVRGTRKGADALVHPSSSSFTNSTLFPSAQLVYDSFSTLTSFALVPPLWLMACRSWRLTAN